MTGQSVFNLSMDLIKKRNSSGVIDTSKTAQYKALAPGLLSLWQMEVQSLMNSDLSDPITDLSAELTVTHLVSAPYFLAANFLLIEDSDSAAYFNEKYEELVKRIPATSVDITDVYGVDSNGGD